MKKLIMFLMVLMLCLGFAGEVEAEPVCLVVCPTDAGDGDEVTVTAYDENGEWFDLSGEDGVELCFGDAGCIWSGGEGDEALDVTSGDGVFTITQDQLDSNIFDFWSWPAENWFTLANPDDPESFDTVAEAVAAGGNCEGLGCDDDTTGPPKIAIVDANDIYEPQDPCGPPLEGRTSDKMLVSLPAAPYAANTITVVIDPNTGDGPHEDFKFIDPPTDPNGNVYLTFDETNWNIPQEVAVEAVADLDKEGDESYDVLFTFSDLLDDPNFNSDPGNPLITSVTVIDNDIPFVMAIPREIELSENDPCTCVELKVSLSHEPTDDVYVRVYPVDWAFDAGMAFIDPPLNTEGISDPNVLTFTTVKDAAWVPGTMTSGWNVEQTITVCPIDNDELAEAWVEWIEGGIYLPSYSQDVWYLVPWWNADGTDADNPETGEEETSDGEAEETSVSVSVQDNDCGAWGYVDRDLNEDCVVTLSDLAIFAQQWALCTDPTEEGCERP